MNGFKLVFSLALVAAASSTSILLPPTCDQGHILPEEIKAYQIANVPLGELPPLPEVEIPASCLQTPYPVPRPIPTPCAVPVPLPQPIVPVPCAPIGVPQYPSSCGPAPREESIGTLDALVLPAVDAPVFELPSPVLPPPAVISNTCTCTKTVLKPKLYQRVIQVQKNQRFLKKTYTPVVEKIPYSARPSC